MPLSLKDPEKLTIDAVRITGFTATIAPRSLAVSYERGYYLGEKFVPVESRSASFDAAAIAGVDPDDKVYAAVKGALYALIQPRAGAGTVS